MRVSRTQLADVLILEPPTFEDERGVVWESHNRRTFAGATGVDVEFVQDLHSRSRGNVLRGLHYQIGRPQGKLIRVLRGEIFDVAVDLRRASATFKRWVGISLSSGDSRMVWIPPGFAHGFYATTEAEIMYKLTEYYSPEQERTLIWDEPEIGIQWPAHTPLLSHKDRAGQRLAELEVFP